MVVTSSPLWMIAYVKIKGKRYSFIEAMEIVAQWELEQTQREEATRKRNKL